MQLDPLLGPDDWRVAIERIRLRLGTLAAQLERKVRDARASRGDALQDHRRHQDQRPAR